MTRTLFVGLAVLGVAAIALTAVLVLSPDRGTPPSTQAGPASSPSPSATATPDGSAETTFLQLTAAHLCAIQSTVYQDPEELARAYATRPDYPGLGPETVARLERRIREEAAFSERLTAQVSAECG